MDHNFTMFFSTLIFKDSSETPSPLFQVLWEIVLTLLSENVRNATLPPLKITVKYIVKLSFDPLAV